MQPEAENARIRSVWLGIEDHNILTMMIDCEGESWGQGYGHYSVENPNYDLAQCLRGLLQTFKVDEIGKLKGLPCRIARSNGSPNGMIRRIGHFLEDRWFNFEDWKK